MNNMRVARLGHKKSRNGCRYCKGRHVKCDEKRPCGNCVKHRVTCSLVGTASPAGGSPAQLDGHDNDAGTTATSLTDDPDTEQTSSLGSNAHDATLPSGTHHHASMNAAAGVVKIRSLLQNLTSEIDMLQSNMKEAPVSKAIYTQDLRLIHHYSREACFTLVDHPSLIDFWQKTVPDMAFSCDFLLHGMLAFSARHLAHIQSPDGSEWESVSKHHQSVTVSLFSDRLNNITEDNVDACFLHACFIFMLETHSIATSPNKVSPADVAGTFILLQGAQSILWTEPGQSTKSGGLAPLIHRAREPVTFPSANFKERMEALQELVNSLEKSEGQTSATRAYSSALDALLLCFEESDALHLYSCHVWLWAVSIRRDFVELIISQKPLALLILAHYAAIVNYFEKDRWYLQGWSSRVVRAVQDALHPPWNSWMTWPIGQLENQHLDMGRYSGSRGFHGASET